MRKWEFPYQGLHDYLDKHLSSKSSDVEITKAKKVYKGLYNSALKKYRREVLEHLTISFTKMEHKRLLDIAQKQDVSVYQYIKHSSLSVHPLLLPTKKLVNLQQEMMEILDLLDDLQDQFQEQRLFNNLKHKVEKLDQQILKLTE